MTQPPKLRVRLLEMVGRGYATDFEADDPTQAGVYLVHSNSNDQLQANGTNCVYSASPIASQNCVEIGNAVVSPLVHFTHDSQANTGANVVAFDGTIEGSPSISDNPGATHYAVTSVQSYSFANGITPIREGASVYFGPSNDQASPENHAWVIPGLGCKISNIQLDISNNPLSNFFTVALYDNGNVTNITGNIKHDSYKMTLLSNTTYFASAGHSMSVHFQNPIGTGVSTSVRGKMEWACSYVQ